jgi:signal transduction histidine kinase
MNVPEKFRHFKTTAWLAIFSLPPVALAVTAWLLSVYTGFLQSPGQILLAYLSIFGLVILSGYLVQSYILQKYLKPLDTIIFALQGIINKNFKPLPPHTYLGDFEMVYTMITRLQQSFNQNTTHFSSLNQSAAAVNKLFETTVSETTDPVIVLNRNFEVKYINSSVENFSGLKRMDINGRRIDQFVRFYDKNNNEILPSVYAPVKKENTPGKIFSHSETKIVSNINRQSFADITVLQPELGEAIDVSCVILFQDKTKEKQLEAMKLDFVSMAAHELRTPLTSIKGYISVFIKENEQKLTADQMMFITRINTSTQQLAGLVENLLSVSRVERGAMSLHTQIVDWVANVKSQVETFEHRSDEKRIKLTFISPKDKIPSVQVDLVRINEVVNNLVSNALNYTEPMGKIDIWIEHKDGLVFTHVKDTGKGIPKEALNRLFEKFFRVQGGPAEQASKGNGLGL